MNSKYDGIPDYEMRSHLEHEELSKELQAEAREKVKDLEEAFTECFDENLAKIDEHMKAARESVAKALALSEETGIPIINGQICLLNNPYRPYSFEEKWGKLSNQFLMDFDIYEMDDRRAGWQYSDLCW